MRFIRHTLVVLLLLSGISRSWSVDAFARLYHERTALWEGTAQAELISSQGTRILIDVFDPGLLSKPATDDDVLLTTHRHPDHINSFFLLAFNGQVLSGACDLSVKDVSIRGFPAPHDEGDPFLPENGTNYAFLILMDGIRIAHLGDVGQTSFTKEQLDLLGEVDVAFMQFDNVYSDMNLSNKKGFNLMTQLKPKIVIPHHFSSAAAKHAATLWPCYYSEPASVSLNRARIPGSTCILLLGESSRALAQQVKASVVNW